MGKRDNSTKGTQLRHIITSEYQISGYHHHQKGEVRADRETASNTITEEKTRIGSRGESEDQEKQHHGCILPPICATKSCHADCMFASGEYDRPTRSFSVDMPANAESGPTLP